MGLMDQVTGATGGALGQGSMGGVTAILLQQLVSMLSRPGALSGMIEAFQRQGHGNVMDSWLSNGQNLPISADHVRNVLGHGTISELARKAGLNDADTAAAVSGLLPQVVDRISPHGQPPAASDLQGLLASVGKLLG
jgi:uncharacterized protein YidB (DUF937 family)